MSCMRFNIPQEFVRRQYCGGEFSDLNTRESVAECGDGLFVFLMNEAQDAQNMQEFEQRLRGAIAQLRLLQGELVA